MSRKAIDIVLFPDANIMDLSRSLNQNAFESGQAAQLLGVEDFIPHISLLMGVVEDGRLADVISILEDLSSKHGKIELEYTAIKDHWMHISKTPELVSLQQDIFTSIDPYLLHDAREEDFVRDKDEHISDDCYPWVNKVSASFSREQYKPHLTIGNPSADIIPILPITGISSRIGICHLGRFNTCRSILFETNL